MHEHATLTTLLDDVCRMVEDGEIERAEHHFGEVVEAFEKHIQDEEETTYTRLSDVLAGPLAELRQEHRQILETLDTMADALDANDLRHFWDGVASLGDLLPSHDAKETDFLHPLITGLARTR